VGPFLVQGIGVPPVADLTAQGGYLMGRVRISYVIMAEKASIGERTFWTGAPILIYYKEQSENHQKKNEEDMFHGKRSAFER
jgi:hypothetical protein